MGKLIEYSKSFKSIEDFFNKHNSGKTMGDPDRLKQSSLSIAKELVRLYGHQLKAHGMLFIKGSVGAELYNDIPPLTTNNPQIARKVGVTDRTVRTHIKRLLDVGLLMKKRNHGPVKDFEIWINPEILTVVKKLDKKEIDDKISKEIIAANQEENEAKNKKNLEKERKIFPPNVSCNTRNINNINNTPVDKESAKADDSNSDSQKSESQDTTQDTRECENLKIKTTNSNQKNSAALKKSKKYYCESFWSLALSLLYHDMDLPEHQIIIAKQHIEKYYELGKTKKEIKRWHEHYCKRLVMAANYYDKHPDYNKHLPSHYLDPTNKKGFTATREWFQKYNRDRIKTLKNRTLSLMLRKIKAEPDDLGIFKISFLKIRAFRDQELLDRFNKKVLEIKKNKIYV